MYTENSYLRGTYFSKFDTISPLFGPLSNCSGAQIPHTPICTTMEAHVLRVMHTKFGQNWARTFRVDVENMNFPYITQHMSYVNFDPKTCNLFFNGSFQFVQI